jgi:hypothetical protein
MKKTTEDLQYLNGILSRTQELIARCDQKIYITMALLSGFWALYFDNRSSFFESTLLLVIFGIACAFCVVALVLLTTALFARFSRSKNIEFFTCIRFYNANELKREFDRHCTRKKYYALIEEIYVNYKIANIKHIFYNIGLCFTIGSIILLLISSFL